ncbi:MAG: hypothetical protein IPQ08_05505 [Chitinophagaceae bacterium]|nr:hypothetical protein [Chitinophagaceae bacterium]
MKKLFIASIIGLFSFLSVSACDICGCGLGNYYIGMMPQFNHKFFGVRYQLHNFHTVMAGDPSQFSTDHYKTLEFWGGWNVGKKWQLIAILPYHFVHQVSDDGIKDNHGFGDIAIMANYKLIDKNSNGKHNKGVSQQLWIGGGLKLPTGSFHVDATDPEIIALANTQTGSASTDILLNTMYNVRFYKFGINTSASYKINTANKDKYEFGNKFSLNTIGFYSISQRHFTILPNMGLSYEKTAASQLENTKIDQTGGHLFAASAGVELSFPRFTIGASTQLPIEQNFADGQTELKVKAMVHLTFSL